MTTKRFLFFILVLGLVSETGAQVFDQFEEFVKKSQSDFDAFKEKNEKDFCDFLKDKWGNFELHVGTIEKEEPAPPIPDLKAPDKITSFTELGLSEAIPEPKEEVVALPEVTVPKSETMERESSVKIVFFGETLNITYDKGIKLQLKSNDEAGVAGFWKSMDALNNQGLMYTCQLIQETYRLNDWGYYQLVKVISEAIHGKNRSDEQAVFSCYLLDKIGYDVRLCLVNKSRLRLMLHTQQMIYGTSYYMVSGKKYFIVGDNNSKSCRTYSGNFDKGNKKSFDLTIQQPIRLKNDYGTYKVSLPALGETIDVRYNKNAIDFYKSYPMTDFGVYFNSRGSAVLESSLYKQLKTYIEGKSEYEAVNFLLHFSQFGFKYATDKKQFGHEKYFFLEELFSYSYSDCEDRSVLFARVVRELLNLPVIGLSYPGHMATAVRLSGTATGDYVVYNNEKYYICDPTYSGAKVGQSMPDFKNKKATPIIVN